MMKYNIGKRVKIVFCLCAGILEDLLYILSRILLSDDLGSHSCSDHEDTGVGFKS